MLHIKKNILLISAFVSSVFTNNIVCAEDVPAIVVSAARTYQSSVTIPTNIKIISREQIENSGANNVLEVIRSVGGVHVTDLFGDGTQSSVSMRGFNDGSAGSNTLIVVDGRRINNIDLSDPDLSSISIKDIEQVEIMQSSAGVLYGDQAVGGVINIVTRKPGDFSVDAKVQVGSYSRNRFQTRFTDKVNEQLSYAVSGDFLRTKSYRDNNKLDNMNILGHIDYEYKTGNVFAEYQRIVKDQELPGALSTTALEENRRQAGFFNQNDFGYDETNIYRLGTRAGITDSMSLEMELASREFKLNGLQFGSANTIESDQLEFTPRLIFMLPFNNSDALITTGIDYLTSDYESLLTDEHKVESYYMQAVIPVLENTSVTVGGRHARVEDDMVSTYTTGILSDRATAYELGVQSKISQGVSVFVRYDENFRFAKVDELSYVSPGESLEIQTGESKEIGVKIDKDRYVINAQIYRLDLKDEIAYDVNAVTPVGGLFPGANVNFDPTTHEGIILEANYSPSKAIDLNTAFTYTDAKFTSGVFAGNKISGVPERKLSLIANYRQSRSVKGYLEAVFTDEHYASGDNANVDDKVDSYTVVNANLSYQWDELEISARVNNLFDKEYSSSVFDFSGFFAYYPSPERNFWLTMAVKFD